jgi:hypothetical protein
MTGEFPHWHHQASMQTKGGEWRFVWWCYLIYLMMVHVLEEPSLILRAILSLLGLSAEGEAAPD